MNGVLTGAAAPTNSVIVSFPPFATQTLPELSIATAFGRLKFAPDGAKFPHRVPVLLQVFALPPLACATQTRPELSIASPTGWLNIEPVGAKLPNRVPALFRAVTVSPAALAAPTWTELSIAT